MISNGFTRNVRRETPPARGIQGMYRESRFITRFKLAYLPMLSTSQVSNPYSASNRDRFGIEEKIMLWNKLPPPRFEDFKRHRVDVRCLDDKQTARPHSLSCSANEASRRIHMLDDMKTRDDIEVRPRQTLNDVRMYRNDGARCGRQFGIRLHAVRIEPFSCGPQKVSSRAAGLEQFS